MSESLPVFDVPDFTGSLMTNVGWYPTSYKCLLTRLWGIFCLQLHYPLNGLRVSFSCHKDWLDNKIPGQEFQSKFKILYPAGCIFRTSEPDRQTGVLLIEKFYVEKETEFQRPYWKIHINKIQRDATVCRCLFTAKLLYMFRVSIAPIIRTTSKCNCSFWYRS